MITGICFLICRVIALASSHRNPVYLTGFSVIHKCGKIQCSGISDISFYSLNVIDVMFAQVYKNPVINDCPLNFMTQNDHLSLIAYFG